MGSINSYGGSGDKLSTPPLGGPGGWAEAVAAVLNDNDTTVDFRIAAAIDALPPSDGGSYGAHYVILVAGVYGYRGATVTDRPTTPTYAEGAFVYVDTSTDATKVTPPSELNPVVGDVWKPHGSVTPVSG